MAFNFYIKVFVYPKIIRVSKPFLSMKNLFYLIALAVAIQACNQPQNQNTATSNQIIVNGVADKAYNGQSVMLVNQSVTQRDTAEIVNGHFQIKMPFKQAADYRFYGYNQATNSNSETHYDVLVAQPGTIAIKADMANLEKSVVTGAPDNDLYQSFLKSDAEITQQIYRKLAEKYGKDYEKHFESADPLYKEVMAYYEKLASALNANKVEFVQKNANSFAALYMLQDKDGELDSVTRETLYNRLSNKYKQTPAARFVINKIRAENVTALGKPAPDFELADPSGKMVNLQSFRDKYVLLDFWASWCGVCREEKPNLIKTYQKFSDKGFTVLGISLDHKKDKANWLAAIHQDKLEWQQVADLHSPENKAAILYGVTSIPDNILVGPDGKIVAKHLTDENLNKKLQELLSAK